MKAPTPALPWRSSSSRPRRHAGAPSTHPATDRLTAAERELRRDIADLLHRIVAGMKLDNFVVRPHRRWVETYVNRAAWDTLEDEQFTGIAENLSGLPSSERDDDELAKRFDLLILRAQLCVINAEPGFTRIRDAVREIADALLDQTSIPAINEQRSFLEALAEEQWWQDVTLPMSEQASARSVAWCGGRSARDRQSTRFGLLDQRRSPILDGYAAM